MHGRLRMIYQLPGLCLYASLFILTALLAACRSETPQALSSKQLPRRDLIAVIQ
jgi:hypothetical protein